MSKFFAPSDGTVVAADDGTRRIFKVHRSPLTARARSLGGRTVGLGELSKFLEALRRRRREDLARAAPIAASGRGFSSVPFCYGKKTSREDFFGESECVRLNGPRCTISGPFSKFSDLENFREKRTSPSPRHARHSRTARVTRRTTGLGEYSPSSSKPSDGARHWRHSRSARDTARAVVAAADGRWDSENILRVLPGSLTARGWRHSHARHSHTARVTRHARGTVARRARGLGEISKVKVRGRSRAPLTFARTDNSQSAQITFKISENVWT